MTRIVTTHYRYKPPSRKRKAAPLACRATCEARYPEGLMEYPAVVPQLLSFARQDA